MLDESDEIQLEDVKMTDNYRWKHNQEKSKKKDYDVEK